MATHALPKSYDPGDVEPTWATEWVRRGYFHAAVDPHRRPYTIMLPLPNVTGELHIGHASTFAVQDVLMRWRRMQGHNALWQPGTDHAGIATQNVVERELATAGVTREQLGREQFVERVWQWKEQYGDIIVQQLKRMGFSCDWDRFVFTLDPAYSEAVLEAFVRLYDQGLIYRGKYMVNWCPRDESAISDLEVEHVEVDTQLWYVRYRGADGGPGVVIATQRPETILADVAVAVHPEDARYAALVGTEVIVPLVNRRVRVIADARVDPEFGTGALKITPGHAPLDYEIGRDHRLPTLVILDPKGRMTAEAAAYAGLDRFEARRAIGDNLRTMGLVERVEPYRTSVGTCDRCHTVIEPYISDQWFVDMTAMATRAAEAIRAGRVTFHHERWARVVLHFLDHIRPWTISRQLWWGHRIPVWWCDACGEKMAATTAPPHCRACGGASLRQDPDVLDTWFSSAIWPFATLGWPQDTPDLRYFYPGSVLVTANEILFLWVARMVMLGLHIMDDVPFTDVYVAPTVLTLDGRRMSKSLGTGIDPLEMADTRGYGADAVRFALVSRCSQGQQDLRFAEKMIADVRNFTTKVWNATRFVLMHLHGFDHRAAPPEPGALSAADRWIRSRHARLVEEVTTHLEAFELERTARALYDFIWSQYCDWYLEMAKVDLQQAPAGSRRHAVQHTLWSVLSSTMQLLHPIMPFLTEEVWQLLPHDGDSIMISAWPAADARRLDPPAEAEMTAVMEVVRTVRSLRADLQIPAAQLIPLHLHAGEAERAVLEQASGYLGTLARVAPIRFETMTAGRPAQSVAAMVPGVELFLPLGGVVDSARERKRLADAREALEREVSRLLARLSNQAFLAKAPADVVERDRIRLTELQERQQRLEKLQRALELEKN